MITGLFNYRLISWQYRRPLEPILAFGLSFLNLDLLFLALDLPFPTPELLFKARGE